MDKQFVFLGNELWLDFINTVLSERDQKVDLLTSKGDWQAWVTLAGLDPKGAAAQHPLHEVIHFRNVLTKAAEDLVSGLLPTANSIREVNSYLKKGSFWEIFKDKEELKLREVPQSTDALSMVARSFAESMASPKAKLIRQCEANDCVLYFVDTSKSHKRRWCSMKMCGNRSKVSAFFKREKEV